MNTIKGEYQNVKQNLKEILDSSNLPQEDKQEVLMMFHHVYYQLHDMAAAGRAMERILEENNIKVGLNQYLVYRAEEEKKFPW